MAVTYRGSNSQGASNGSDASVNLSGLSMAENDVVVAVVTIADNDNTDFTMAVNESGWTKVADLHADDTYDCDLGVFVKRMGATPDSAVTGTGQGGTDSSTCVAALALTGVDPTLDLSTLVSGGYVATDSGTNTANADPPSIGSVVSGGAVVICGGCATNGGASVSLGAPTNYTTNAVSQAANDTSDAIAAVAYRTDASGTENPGAFAYSGSDSTSFSWCAVTIFLPEASSAPTITDAGDEDFRDGETSVVITGTNFSASGNTVELGDSATYGSANLEEQTITSEGTTSITITVVLGSTLAPGALWLYVTDADTNVSNAYAVAVHRKVAITLSASDYIAASGADTSALLTAPSGKTTGDFGGGRIQDDENPGDAVDLADGEYREDEWCLVLTTDAIDAAAYDFRVLYGGEVADTVSVTPTVTVSSTNNYTITGDVDVTVSVAATTVRSWVRTLTVSVGCTVAATMAFNQHPEITGDVSVGSTVAAAMAYNTHPQISGDVTVDCAVAAAMDYTRNASIAGDITVDCAVAAAMVYNLHREITGSVDVTSTVAAAMAYTIHPEIVGAVDVTSTVAASALVYNQHPELAGAVTVDCTVAAAMEYAATQGIVGSVTVTITPDATTVWGWVRSGDVTVSSTVAATLAYNAHPSITGDVPVACTVAADMAFTQHPELAGDVTVTAAVAAAMAFTQHPEISGDVTVTATVAADMAFNNHYVIVGAVTVSSTVAAGLEYANHYTITGAVTVDCAVAAAMEYVAGTGDIYTIDGDVTVDCTVAASLAYNRNASIAGAVTVTASGWATDLSSGNPGFETAFPLTWLVTSATGVRDTEHVHTGSYALKVSVSAAYGAVQFRNDGLTQWAVHGSQPYRHDLWVYATGDAVGTEWVHSLVWSDSDSLPAGTNNDSVTLVEGWQVVSYTVTSPSNAAYLYASFYANGDQGTPIIWVDDATLTWLGHVYNQHPSISGDVTVEARGSTAAWYLKTTGFNGRAYTTFALAEGGVQMTVLCIQEGTPLLPTIRLYCPSATNTAVIDATISAFNIATPPSMAAGTCVDWQSLGGNWWLATFAGTVGTGSTAGAELKGSTLTGYGTGFGFVHVSQADRTTVPALSSWTLSSATRTAIPTYNKHPTISGSVDVSSTVAASMAYNRNAAITGDVSVSVTPAATMVYNQHPSIAGAVTVEITPAATMAYKRVFVASGTGTWGDYTGSGTAVEAFSGSGTGPWAGATADGTGVLAYLGAGTGVLTPVGTGDGTAVEAFVGSGTGEWGEYSGDGTSTVPITGGGTGPWPPPGDPGKVHFRATWRPTWA